MFPAIVAHHFFTAVLIVALGASLTAPAHAQAPAQPAEADDPLRVSVALLAGYGHDAANAPLGFEKQGRVGYAIIRLEGRVAPRVSYRLSLNPVNEVAPRPACGEAGFFYPNQPDALYTAGPEVACDPADGSRRVDLYRGIALDVVPQQGAVREAYADLAITPAFQIRFGRFVVPVGFDWEDAGALTAKDATLIQRINAEGNFGLQFRLARRDAGGRPWLSATAAAVQGDGNRWKDYDYFYFHDPSLDTNSALAAVGDVRYAPSRAVEIRASFKGGFTGSKVERLPSYWASKRNDHATVISAAVRPVPAVRLLGEWARYVWGPTRTSAEMLGVDTDPIVKTGAYLTVEVTQPVHPTLEVGASVTVERIDRADSLVHFLATNAAFDVTEDRVDRMSVLRVFVDSGRVRLGGYFNAVQNPFPWISGIYPVSGPFAFTGRSLNRWGIMVRVSLEGPLD
jgi:hypothetical protein